MVEVSTVEFSSGVTRDSIGKKYGFVKRFWILESSRVSFWVGFDVFDSAR